MDHRETLLGDGRPGLLQLAMVPTDDLLRYTPLGASGVLRKASLQRARRRRRRPPAARSCAPASAGRATGLRRQVRGIDDREQAAAQPGARRQVEEPECIGAALLVRASPPPWSRKASDERTLVGRELACRPGRLAAARDAHEDDERIDRQGRLIDRRRTRRSRPRRGAAVHSASERTSPRRA